MDKDRSPQRILILDDDIELCELLHTFLTGEGFIITVRHDPQEILNLSLEAEFDLVILDVMLPHINGLEVLKRIRTHSAVPVIMLTARGEEIDRIVGLELGADDYLPKPFNPRELSARIRAVIRRGAQKSNDSGTAPQPPHPESVQVGDVRLMLGSRQALCNNEEVPLTGVEFRLLEVLMRSAGTVVKRQDLALQVLERHLSYEDRSLDVHISNLRRKLGKHPSGGERIQTIRGIGYLFSVFENTSEEKL
ncbi:MAG TPA: response regulator transcription factor [Candidatus Ozemobacteraceae bacterium]|nr:response regulator transcription factor [Candidatus Ozemobacteraceae bacterium]